MPATDTVKYSLEGVLSYHTNPVADELVTSGWVTLSYADGFTIEYSKNKIVYFDRYDRQPPKKGRQEITGSLGQLYTNAVKTLLKLAKDDALIALKLDIMENGGSTVTETLYLNEVDLNGVTFDAKSSNEETAMTVTANYTAKDFKYVPAA